MAIAAGATTQAFATPNGSPYDGELSDSLLVTGGALAIAISGYLIEHERPAPVLEELRADDVNGFDRWVIGPGDKGSALASDIIASALIFGPYIFGGLDYAVSEDRLEGWSRDAFVMLETQAVTAAATQLIKLAIERPRPVTYQTGYNATNNDAVQSFFSGHTALTFASAVAYSTTFARRHPHDDEWVWIGTLLGAGAVGALRVSSRRHFPTDVITGATIGALIGWLVPRARLRDDDTPATQSGAQTFGLVFSGSL